MVQSQKSDQSLKHLVAPFRGDHVGSLLRSDRIKDARTQKLAGEISAETLRLIENTEITRIVEKQKEVGLQAVTDGEFRRAWWHFDFLEGLEGVEGYESDSGIQFHGTKTKAHAVKVTGKIDFKNHPMLEHYKFLHNIAGSHTAKMTIPSPNMLYFRAKIENELYQDQNQLFHDLTQAYQKAIQAFYDAGCRYLQLDDTAWAVFFSEQGKEQIQARGEEPEQLQQFFARSINEAIAKRPSDMKITMHICRGNFKSTYTASGGYDAVSETLFDGLDVDGLFLEYDNDRSGGFEPLRYVKRPNLQIVLGLITSKFGNLEDPELVKRRIADASNYVDLNQLCLSPQCGFASTEEGNILTEEQQWAKLRHVLEISDEVWK
ncbi:5-methyltetrahydropteroyltriglutamate--homocysteine S-methyltransferase [Virgibacillus necropolis]|uniref:5-methyltetrahydropteroyltriglutamate--homocysteine methyltransferase n=1 Tax=Virgibacillus necropolis TaxID=163877 RepID=A0A221MGF4_9BACI|nr:5-methyltetrahydropteroyltriglutamate--homocysteine S-methyltransferase [Virgibacillus necropolis]ASN06721.1 5-methyltetrahydropteroyltriglutamate--homocysteine methyltransferase [Virgibacillus necropolis]